VKIRFWGTRGSLASPGPGTTYFGGNTSCVQVTTENGGLLILDCGTGARQLGRELETTSLKPIKGDILLGHTHWDHIQGFPFFKPVFMPGSSFSVWAPKGGSRSLQETLSGQMEFTYFPVELAQLPAQITYHELAEGTYEIGGARVTTQYLNHPAVTLGYRIEADGAVIVYVTDHEQFSDKLWRGDADPGRIDSMVHDGDRRHARFMVDADLVIHDAQYTPEEYESKKTWGHSTYEYVVDVAAAAGVKRVALTHHDPDHNDLFVADIEQRARAVAEKRGSPIEIFCAHEGGEYVMRGDHFRPTAAREEGAPLVAPPVAGARLLVVDDDPLLRRLAVKVLARYGHTVSEAENGREALRIIDGQPPDLVVLDLEMPEMPGLEVLRAIRAKPATAHLPVLILTVSGNEAATSASFEAGATDYLTKPFSIPQLTARVHACLERAAQRRG
jgi:CheY-like chemotaxis protein/phosphoribosyl 1,2-cyclic phosphodiesterase